MWIICRITNVMPYAVFTAIEHIISTASDVDGIDEAIFTEGIGKVPKSFLVAGGNEIELVTDATDGSTLHFAMQEETGGNGLLTMRLLPTLANILFCNCWNTSSKK